MSSISSNYGMESLNIAMSKRQSDSQGNLSLQLLSGAVQSAQQIQAQGAAVAAQAQSVTPVVEGAKGGNIDTTA